MPDKNLIPVKQKIKKGQDRNPAPFKSNIL